VRDMKGISMRRPRFGARRVHNLLTREGWRVNEKRIERLWRREGLQVPQKQRKRRRGGGEDGQRRRAERIDQVWSYDFLFDRLEDGRRVKVLTILDEYSREALDAFAARSIRAEDVIGRLETLMVERGVPEYLRADDLPPENGATAYVRLEFSFWKRGASRCGGSDTRRSKS